MASYDETITEDSTLSEATPIDWEIFLSDAAGLNGTAQVTFPVTFINNMTVAETLAADQITQILESIGLIDVLTSSATLNDTFIDIVAVSDIAAVLFGHSILEDITVDDTLVEILEKIGVVVDQLEMADLGLSQATLNTSVAVALALTDLALQIELIAENVTLADDLLQNVLMAVLALDQVEVADTESEYMAFSVLTDDAITMVSALSEAASLFSLIEDGYSISTKFQINDATYTGWVMNPENYAISTYTNYTFNSIAKFGQDNLMANSSGLYMLGGTLDETTYITSRLKTASMTFGSTSHKQIPEVLLGVNNTGKVILTVSVDGQQTAHYELVPATTYLDTQQIKIGKGLHGRYWQFELITNQNSTFDLDTFEFLPVVFGRKLR